MSTTDDDLPDFWPRVGDLLFVESAWAVDAQIAPYQGERLYRMKEAFKRAGDLLVQQTEENPSERRNLVWPIVFCYRQYIELALKDMIAEHGVKIDPEILPNWKEHGLLALWRSYKILIGATLSSISPDELPEVVALEACIAEFDQVDPGSYTFRYPTDRKGRLMNIAINAVDLLHLRNVMEGIYLFLDANESVLRAHFDSFHV